MSRSEISLGAVSLILLLNHVTAVFDYYVELSNDGPAVIGANVTFTANLFSGDRKIPTGTYIYKWRDNLYPQHTAEFVDKAVTNWTVNYPAGRYKPGLHWVGVDVYTKEILIDWPLCNGRGSFKLTVMLNGNLTLSQNNVTESNEYISNASEVLHTIDLSYPDATFLKHNVSSLTTWWFVDCKHVGNSSDLTFRHRYAEADVTHHINALVYAPLSFVTNHTLPDATHDSPNNLTPEDVSSSTSSDVLLNTIADSSNSKKFSYLLVNKASRSNKTDPDVPFDCSTKRILNGDPKATYGLFSRKIEVKAPITNVTTSGNTWLQHGDMLNLSISCQGSGPFIVCYNFEEGYYNKTGNETCDFGNRLETCHISFSYYFKRPIHYSIVVIIGNDVNKIVRSIGIDVYEVTKLPQLSIIVVPVAAGIAAVVLIIFGIAYYIQSRNRFIVEVADFDFSTNANDMEYKTFRERLVEAVHNAFDKTEDFYEQDSTNGVPANNKKYGSMQ